MTQQHSVPLDRCALFLDFDGTLTSLARTPSEVAANPSVCELVRQAYEKLDGRLAIVSGRTIAEVDRLLDAAAPCIAGVHGLQRRREGRAVEESDAHPMLKDVTEVLQALAGAQVGVLVETKPQSVAVHYRMAPAAEEAVVECAERLAGASGLIIQRGSMVIELRTPGPDKGGAVRAFMEERTFRDATPIYIGDDLTDEAAFEEVARLGGFGILVGDARPTAARYRLGSPPRVLDWLATSLDRKAFDSEGLHWAG